MQTTIAVLRPEGEEPGVTLKLAAEESLRIALISAAIAALRRDRQRVAPFPADDGSCNPWKMSGRLDALRRR